MTFLQLSGKHSIASPLLGLDDVAVVNADDLPFVEVALAGNAASLVTSNVKHFTFFSKYQIPILTPRQFMEAFAS